MSIESPMQMSVPAPAGNGHEARRFSPRKRAARPRWRRWALPTAAMIVVLSLGGWIWHRVAAPSSTASAAQIIAVTRGHVDRSVDSSGKVVSNLDVDIKCRASGEIVKLPFDISQAVKKGDLLCQLDPTDEQLAVRSADAAVAQSQAKVAQAQFDLEQATENLQTTRRRDESELASATVKAANLRAKAQRQKDLVAQQLGSHEDQETAETDAAAAEAAMHSTQIAIDELKQMQIQLQFKQEAVKTAQALLQADQVTLQTQKQQLAYTTVTSPIDAVMSALNVQKGAIVASGMSGFSGGTTICTLSDLSHVFVTATVDESDIGEVRVGQKSLVTVASFPTREFAGQVQRIATKGVNSSNVVTFEVKVEVLDPHKDLLRPEMTGNVRIIQDERDNVLILPESAVAHSGGKTYVTLPTAERREVQLGVEGAEMVEIVSGVKEGDRVNVSAEPPTKWNADAKNDKGPPPPK